MHCNSAAIQMSHTRKNLIFSTNFLVPGVITFWLTQTLFTIKRKIEQQVHFKITLVICWSRLHHLCKLGNWQSIVVRFGVNTLSTIIDNNVSKALKLIELLPEPKMQQWYQYSDRRVSTINWIKLRNIL